jgi:predicted Zn-dependent protease
MTLRFTVVLMLGVYSLALAPGCAQLLPVPPVKSDLEQGVAVAKQVEEQIGLYAAPQTGEYLRQVGQRLVAATKDTRWKFSFQIVEQSEPNAFSIPGGGVYVSRGLLALVTSEDELAGVLGHEIAHVTERHWARQQREGLLSGVLSLPGNLVGNVVSENLGDLINLPVSVAGGAWLSRYSRSQERDADRIGLRTAAQAGYDPEALSTILARLEADAAAQTGQEPRFSIFDSHPMTESRMRDIQRELPRIQPEPRPAIAADPAAFYQKLDGLWWGENPEAGLFRGNRFVHPALGFTITFPNEWKHQNTPQVVMAVHPRQEALLLLRVVGPAADPEAAGQKFVERMRSKAQLEPATTRKVSLGSAPAFVVTYRDASGRTPVYLHFAWVALAGKTFQLIGLAPEKYHEALRDAALSLRPMTLVEQRAVTGKRLRLVEAKEGERLEDLSARTDNVWTPSYTALVNGLKAETGLRGGQRLKIAREEHWSP